MNVGVLENHVVIVTSLVLTDHELTPVFHRQTQETLNHLMTKSQALHYSI